MKTHPDNLFLWASAHVFYNMYTYDIGSKDKITKGEYEWRYRLLNNTPNGKLILDNSFFKELRSKDKIYLAHVTPNIHNIRENNTLYPSAGCLVGSIYCTPLIHENDGLRMHNLGKFIFEREMPLFANFLDINLKKSLNILIFEIETFDVNENNLIGIDYLRLGNIHFNTYKNLEFLLSSSERHNLQEICVKRIQKAFNYLCVCNKKRYSETKVDNLSFLENFIRSIDSLPILGYLYFEVISEYIMLFQDSDICKDFKKLGEFYSPSYKELVFSLCPYLSKNFSLQEFKPSLNSVVDYIKKNEIIKNFDEQEMFSYLADRLAFLTDTRLFSENIDQINWEGVRWNFEDLSKYMRPLLGHLIHRELRNFNRYPYFYFYFEQLKALEVWNYWNYMNIIVPFNGTIPKGEIGINPAHPDLKYKTYLAETKKSNSYHTYLTPQKEINLNIAPKLVDVKFASMRDKCNKND